MSDLRKILIRPALWMGCALLALSSATWAAEVALITALMGDVRIQAADGVGRPARPFVKVRDTDRLNLAREARLELVYFKTGRLEDWSGQGTVLPGPTEGAAVSGTPRVQARTLAPILVKQLAKTPSPEEVARTGMLRVRGMDTMTRVETLQEDFAALRAQAEPTDRTPEAFLLAGYFELRQLPLMRERLRQWRAQAPDDVALAALEAHYRPVLERLSEPKLGVAAPSAAASQAPAPH